MLRVGVLGTLRMGYGRGKTIGWIAGKRVAISDLTRPTRQTQVCLDTSNSINEWVAFSLGQYFPINLKMQPNITQDS